MKDKKPILEKLGIAAQNEMQLAAEKAILQEDDVLLLSATGSGKTLAFLLPIYQLLKEKAQGVQCMVIVPSRELAMQIETVWKKMGTGFKVNACYGGHAMSVEVKNLSQPPALLIGTPGRLADHLTRESFDPTRVHTLVFDEFDKCLSQGFEEEMAFILSHLEGLQKKVLVSATKAVDWPDFVEIADIHSLDFVSGKAQAKPSISLRYIRATEKDKLDSLFKLLCGLGEERSMIFCNHRDAVERISRHLEDLGIPTAVYHGKLEQDDRELALTKFRNGSASYLLCTDLGSRGLDIPEVMHVIHYQLPLKEEDFIHRNGRTARMKASGAVYLVLRDDEKLPAFIPKEIEAYTLPENPVLPKQPEWLTVYIGAGKKNKVNKVDVVGFLSQKGRLGRDELGVVEIRDFAAFAAVKREKVKQLLVLVREEKIKGKKYKVALAR